MGQYVNSYIDIKNIQLQMFGITLIKSDKAALTLKIKK